MLYGKRIRLRRSGAGGHPVIRQMLVALRNRIEERLRGRRTPVDSLVGEVAIPLSDLPGNGTGQAELRGTTWACRNAGERPVARGARCRVEKVDGLTLWIRPE